MDQQILHITEEQLQCIAQKVYETAERAVDCVDRVKFPIEIIDLNRGLDADLYCNIYVSSTATYTCQTLTHRKMKRQNIP